MEIIVLAVIVNIYCLLIETYNFFTLPVLSSSIIKPGIADTDLPKLSILIAAYNHEQVIVPMISYLEKVAYPNFEILIYDDNSLDKTWDLLQKHKLKNMRIFRGLHKTQTQQGETYAWDFLAGQATGQLYLLLDCDVILNDPGLIKQSVEVLMAQSLGLLNLIPKFPAYYDRLYFNTVPLKHNTIKPNQFLLMRANVYSKNCPDGNYADQANNNGFSTANYYEYRGLTSRSNNISIFDLVLVPVIILQVLMPLLMIFFDIRALIPLSLLVIGSLLYSLKFKLPVLKNLILTPVQALVFVYNSVTGIIREFLQL